MSSSTPCRRDRRLAQLAALILAVCVIQSLLAGTALALPLPPITVQPPTARGVPLVVDVGSLAQPQSVSVSVGGAQQPRTVMPVVSDRLSATLVVDASADAGPALPALLSGAARFVIDAPAAARSAVVADTTPPVPVVPLQADTAGTVRALQAVKAHGQRQTVAALGLAVNQLLTNVDGPRVIVLYTTAPDAGGSPAEDISARLLARHVILVVVSTAPGTTYWSTVAQATGGFLAPAKVSSVAPALDQVDAMLRARYLLNIPTPARLPAQVSVRIDMGPLILSGDAVVPAPPPAPGREPAPLAWARTPLGIAAIAVSVLAVVAAALLTLQWRRHQTASQRRDQPRRTIPGH
jgi:hypothetical protein